MRSRELAYHPAVHRLAGARLPGAAAMTPEEWALAIVQSEAFMWLMVGANHPEAHLSVLRGAWDQYRAVGGKTWPAERQDDDG